MPDQQSVATYVECSAALYLASCRQRGEVISYEMVERTWRKTTGALDWCLYDHFLHSVQIEEPGVPESGHVTWDFGKKVAYMLDAKSGVYLDVHRDADVETGKPRKGMHS